MPARIETTWDDIPVTTRSECLHGHARNPKNTHVYTTPAGAIELRCRVCSRLSTAERRRRLRTTTTTTTKGER